MAAWLDGMSLLERAFAYPAMAATVVLLIQTVMMLVGIGAQFGADAGDSDTSGLGDQGMGGHDFSGHDMLDADAGGIDMMDSDAGGAMDMQAAHEAAAHGYHEAMDPGLSLLTIRGLVAFFAIGGWSGLLLLKNGAPALPTLTVATAAGLLAMVLIAMAIRAFFRLQSSGSLDIRNAVGVSGTVYLTIPPARTQKGKVNLTVQGQLRELDAVTDSDAPIKTGSEITVVGLSGQDTVVVAQRHTD